MQISTFSASKLTVFAFSILFSRRTWKLIGLGIVIGSLWYSIHTFINTYNIVWSHGVYGVVTEQKWDEVVNSQGDMNFLEAEVGRLERHISNLEGIIN